MNIHKYVNNIINDGFYWRKIEIDNSIYDINRATLNEIIDERGN